MNTGENFLEIAAKLFNYYKSLADKSIAQVTDEQLHERGSEDENSIAIIMKHIAGNMRSRFTDFLISDGEKPWRQRDQEFVDTISDRATLTKDWEVGWGILFKTLHSLNSEDCSKIVYIRNEGHTVLEAISRQLAHYSYHCGQIVTIAKSLLKGNFRTLSIPKGGSEAYNQSKFNNESERKFFVDGLNK
jgi:hypothetical protein